MLRRRICVLLMAAVMLLTVFPAQNAEASRFTDIDGHWASAYIIKATDMGLFSGTTKTTFSPDEKMTRAMFVTVLASCSGEDISGCKTTRFSDVAANAWYAKAVAWAYNHGVISGTSANTFSPNQPITRQQIAVLMVNYANYRKVILPRSRAIKQFSDSGRCADYALDAICTLYRSGIISGMDSSRFEPMGNTTRAQAAVILCNYTECEAAALTADKRITLINHRGYNHAAPENTMSAFRLSVQKGYSTVETDVRFTKDNVPVLLHDDSIDRTSNGSGRISELTYSQLTNFDFSYVNNYSFSDYRREKIPTYEEFIAFCAQNRLYAYVELKGAMTSDQVKKLISIAGQYGMLDRIIWISFSDSDLKYVKSHRPKATLCVLGQDADDTHLSYVDELRNGSNTVLLSVNYKSMNAAKRAKCLRRGIRFGVWTFDDTDIGVSFGNSSSESITTDSLTWTELYPSR